MKTQLIITVMAIAMVFALAYVDNFLTDAAWYSVPLRVTGSYLTAVLVIGSVILWAEYFNQKKY